MEIHIREKCADCRGTGQELDSWNLILGTCKSCQGKGVIEQWVSLKELLDLLAGEIRR